MITIQSGMLIALGFLAACLLGLLVAPAFWSRAVRLTTRRIKDTVPLSEMEIEADRDRIRAEYAIKMHKLESLVEQVKLAGARQQIEINRRDARVNMLEADLERLRASNEEAQNARRVLEQTITDRLPHVEGRLTEANKALSAREREVDALTRKSEQQAKALAEASSERAAQVELDGLKTKTREQAHLIERLQRLSEPSASAFIGAAKEPPADAAAQADSTGVQDGVLALQTEHAKQMQVLRERNDEQVAEIARLKAAIAVFERESESDGKASIRESKTALKARVQSLEAQVTQQADTAVKLRSELALANERLARQAAHFTNELKRLGSGANVVTQSRRSGTAVRSTLADRVAQARTSTSGATSESPGTPALESPDPAAKPRSDADHLAADLSADRIGPAADGITSRGDDGAPANGETQPASIEEGEKSSPEREVVVAPAARARPRLLDRIAGLSRSS